jgi:hypothetical protein
MTSTASFPIAAALLVGTLLAGCGRSSGEHVTHREARLAEQPADCKRADGFQKCGNQTELQAAATRSRIAFVRCMRTHGVRNFPYPTATGHVSVEMVRARGINPQSPAVARVVSECLPPSLRPPTGP